MATKYKEFEQKDDEESFDAGFKIPDTTSVLQRLAVAEKEELKREHKFEMEKEEKTGQAAKKRQKRGGSICFCEVPHCTIGPFIEKQGE